jgi:hypothetical protein
VSNCVYTICDIDMWLYFVVFLIQSLCSFGLKAEWIQLSDSASLPMSKNYRDNLRERIDRLNMDALNSTERAAILKIRRMLGDEESYLYERSGSVQIAIILGIVSISAWLIYKYFRGLKRSVHMASPDDLRRARNMKYQ